jgi:hypothetical protein
MAVAKVGHAGAEPAVRTTLRIRSRRPMPMTADGTTQAAATPMTLPENSHKPSPMVTVGNPPVALAD